MLMLAYALIGLVVACFAYCLWHALGAPQKMAAKKLSDFERRKLRGDYPY